MMQILIVDDHEVMRHGLRDILQRRLSPVAVTEAKDSREAVARLAEKAWDLVLLDINLPGRSGLDVLAEVRLTSPKTPVLMLTAYPEEQFAVRAFRMGAAGYLNKQSASDELLVAVKRILGGGKYVTASLAERLADSLGDDATQARHECLSNRELQVLRLVAAGKTIKEIALDLSLSEKTVATYRTRIGEKMHLASNVDIARYAVQNGLVE